MARRRLTNSEVSEWGAELALARRFYDVYVKPTEVYARAYRSNAALWEGLTSWPASYHQVSANLVFANTQANMARLLARNPKIHVLPAMRATRMADRFGKQGGADRFLAAALVQQMVNWRWREFDFTRQVMRIALDADTRGFGIARHGFKAEGENELSIGGKQVEIEHHKHIRGGWPFCVHWPVNRVLWDQKAREPDERQWVAFLDWWRPDDLKKKFGLRREVAPTHMIGADLMVGITGQDQIDFSTRYEGALGRVGVWEIWDRRTQRVIRMIHGEDASELDTQDWPLEFEGLPDTMLWPQEATDRMWPVPDVSLYFELQQLLNIQLSMLAIYIKRGVPIIGFNADGIDPEEIQKLQEAEILEFFEVKGASPADKLALLNMQPPIAHLLQGIQVTLDLIREVGGNSKFVQGTRENVETAYEAQAISVGGEIRNEHRARAVERLVSEIVRKDWQIFQQTVTETQVLDIVASPSAPALLKLTPDEIKSEYEFTIAVGSTAPVNERAERERLLGFLGAMQSDPEIRAQMNPRFVAQRLVEAFGFDSFEALATQDAASQQVFVDSLQNALFGGAGGGRGASLGAALDSMKSNGKGMMM